jgi:predicted secreted protein
LQEKEGISIISSSKRIEKDVYKKKSYLQLHCKVMDFIYLLLQELEENIDDLLLLGRAIERDSDARYLSIALRRLL